MQLLGVYLPCMIVLFLLLLDVHGAFFVFQWGRAVQFLVVSMPYINVLFPLPLDAYDAVLKSFNGGDRCSFWEFLCRA